MRAIELDSERVRRLLDYVRAATNAFACHVSVTPDEEIAVMAQLMARTARRHAIPVTDLFRHISLAVEAVALQSRDTGNG